MFPCPMPAPEKQQVQSLPELDSNQEPAIASYYPNGNIEVEEWRTNGLLDRMDGPSLIEYYDTGAILRQEWHWQGKQHRENGPAVIGYFEDGTVAYEERYEKGMYQSTSLF